jgi:hypothetical protein
MTLAALSMIRDEADIIGPFLRHLAALFDIVYLFDHRSSDGSTEIMKAVCADKRDWSYYRLDVAGLHQKEVYNTFFNQAFARGATAVFFIDADEFVATASKADLVATCSRLNEEMAAGLFSLRSCVPSGFNE